MDILSLDATDQVEADGASDGPLITPGALTFLR
jgi:hypothetical protein